MFQLTLIKINKGVTSLDWQKYVEQSNQPLEWPWPVDYDKVNEIEVDVAVLGGGPAGVMASISAAKKGRKVALLDKAYPKRSGGGSGFDHYLNTPNPCTTVTAEDCVEWEAETYHGYSNSLSRYIAARESYDTLLEIEKMGAKVRDMDDEFQGAPFRDEKTKLCFCYDYENKFQLRVWGSTWKPAMFNEAKRLGVQVFDRVVATSLLTEGGKMGARVVGATAFNIRTGQFYIFKAKATIDCMSRHQGNWIFSSELSGLPYFRPNIVGDGHSIGWRAGAEFTMMERSFRNMPPGYAYPSYGTGNMANTWYPATIVDADGKEIPWVDGQGRPIKDLADRTRPQKGQKFLAERSRNPKYAKGELIPDLAERIRKGEYKLPLYADLAGMPWYERKAIWGLMVGNEGRTRIPVYLYYNAAGFDPSKHMLQSYYLIGGETLSSVDPNSTVGYFRQEGPGGAGGIITDWNLMSNLPGFFVAGDALFDGNYYGHACITGRYAGRKAADYATSAVEPVFDKKQVEKERERLYASTKVDDGLDWKEVRAVSARIMQNYCSDIKNEELLNIALIWLKDIRENAVPRMFARNPHELLRVIESCSILDCDEMIVNTSLARKASCATLGFSRQDYTQNDPPEWHAFVTVKRDDGKVITGKKPIGFWGNIKEQYDSHNKDYRGWCKK